jgi:membrane-anchored glycerophosphoryl diester phosphodiesterase (GDPDase)
MANSCSGEVQERDMVVVQEEEAHPYAFHVSGPRNVASPNWRDLISSSWSVLLFLVLLLFFLFVWVQVISGF